MRRIAILIGLLVANAAAPAAADVLVVPNQPFGEVQIWARDSHSPTVAPNTRGAENQTPKQPWNASDDCPATGPDPILCLITLNGPTSGGVTPGRIEEAIRRIGLPGLPVRVLPATRTLVNADTIVYTEPAPFDDTVTLLGETVRIHAIPATYTWHFGDGTTTTTTDPGAPWPDKTVTHRYQHTADAVTITLTVGYQVTYSTNGALWKDLEEPIYAVGPGTTIAVTEALAVLVAR